MFSLRLVAAGMIIISLALYSTDIGAALGHQPELKSKPFVLVLKALPLLLGFLLYAKSKALANQLTKDLD